MTKSVNTGRVVLSISASDNDSDALKLLVMYFLKSKSRSRTSELSVLALKSFYAPMAAVEKKDSSLALAPVFSDSVAGLIKQMVDLLLLARSEGVSIPDHLLAYGIETLTSQRGIQSNSQPLTKIPEFVSAPIAVSRNIENPMENMDVSNMLGLEEDEEDAFGHIPLPTDIDYTDSRIEGAE